MPSKAKYGVYLLIFAIIALSNLQPTSCYSWHSSFELWDLEFNDARFEEEVKAWSATNLLTPGKKHYVCANDYLMGGYKILGGTKGEYFERIYTDLPPHNQLNLTYLAYTIDSWDGTSVDDHYEVYVDGYIQRGFAFSAFNGDTVAKCGSPNWGEYPPVLAVSSFIHNASSVKIRFMSMLNQGSDDESLGIREVKMKFINVTTPQNSLCGRSTANVSLPDRPCQGCDSPHEYISFPPSGKCFECASSCATCNAAGASGCTSCDAGSYFDAKTCKKCDSTCTTCVNNANYCLTCQPSLFMVSNVCFPKCTYPLFVTEEEGINYCKSPCPKDQFAMWDSSCSASCSGGLVAATMSTYQVCTFPCSLNPIAS